MAKISALNTVLTISSFLGLGLSIYSFLVEQQGKNYVAYCDISETISCSKTFKSKYGTGFGVMEDLFGKDFILNKPNSFMGIIFYSLMVVLAQSNSKVISLIVYVNSIISLLLSLFLAYAMVAIIKTVCVVCIATYFVNIINFFVSYAKYSAVRKIKRD